MNYPSSPSWAELIKRNEGKTDVSNRQFDMFS